MTRQNNPGSPAYQESVLQDGFDPADDAKTVMASVLAGPSNPDGPVPDEVQQAQMLDPPTVAADQPIKPPPGSIATHTDIGDYESQHNTLSDRNYSMLKEPE